MYDGIQRDLVGQDNYETAHPLAKDRLRAGDFAGQCQKAGAEVVDPAGGICRIHFINRDYRVDHSSGEVNFSKAEEQPTIWERIIILHYLANAQGVPETGELISYQQIPDGWLYYPSFVRRTAGILVKTFSRNPEAFREAGLAIGGKPSSLGKYAVEVLAFPKVKYHFLMWPGDDEFEAEVKCVFDKNIMEYLPAEDITVLANIIAIRLVRSFPLTSGSLRPPFLASLPLKPRRV